MLSAETNARYPRPLAAAITGGYRCWILSHDPATARLSTRAARIGAILGARYHYKVKTSVLKKILSSFALFAGFQLILLLFNL